MLYKIHINSEIYEGDHDAVFITSNLDGKAHITYVHASPEHTVIRVVGAVGKLVRDAMNDLWIGTPAYNLNLPHTVVWPKKGGKKCSSPVTKRRASKSTSASR